MAPGARRGKSTGLSLNGSGRRTAGEEVPSEDVGMADAPGAGGPDRRKRSGRGAVNSRTGKTGATPYASTSSPSRIAGAARASSSRGSGERPVNGILPSGLADRLGIRGSSTSTRGKSSVIKESINIKGAIQALKQLIQSRWDPTTGLLNLQNMASDPAFATSQLKPPSDRAAPKNAAPALWKLAGDLCPNIQSLSLEQNNLSSLIHLAPAAIIRYLPKLQNLSLSNNNLSNYADLNPLSNVVGTISGSKPGLSDLRELVLTGNPLQEKEMAKNPQDYQNEIRRRFPSLHMLDSQTLDRSIPVPNVASSSSTSTSAPQQISIAGSRKRQAEEQGESSRSGGGRGATTRTKAVLPLTMQAGFADSDASRNAMGQFLIKYFTSYDGDRMQLGHAYVPQATFSLSANTALSERARRSAQLPPEQISKQRELTWSSYLGSAYGGGDSSRSQQENLSRNFLRTKQAQRREETLHVGPERIVATLQKLPKTSHPLGEASNFVVDTYQQPGQTQEYPDLLIVVVHGEFTEHPSMGLRSFERTFVLAPAAPGSPAATNGWPCVIISDMLVLRNWTNPSVWKVEEAGPGQASAATPAQPDPSAISPEQQALMGQLHAQTRLNAQFCFQCLSETGWNLQAALQAFEAAKASIPAEAFA